LTLLDRDGDLEGALATWLSREREEEVSVARLTRFHGGAARETYRFEATGERGSEWLILRRDPPASLIATSRAVEFHVLGRAHAAGLPAPEPLHLDPDGSALGAPGFVMRSVEGGRAAGLFETDPYGEGREALGAALFEALGRLHALPPTAGDRAILPAHDAAGRLAHWAGEIERHPSTPQPVAMAALRWLSRHLPPPSGPPAIVHGDFRSGNFLVDPENRLLAVLDWEMAHLGDPMEDLAWAADPLWRQGSPDLVGGMVPEAAMIAAWEATSGRTFDRAAWAWWRLFAGFAGLAIWITSAHEVAAMRSVDPVMVFSALYPLRFHNASVAEALAGLSP
jgi:aminoglycoside phosphotransferase (APT) family kinase protein